MKGNKRTGFTLVELLIAIFILMMGILAILAIFPMGTQVEKSTQILTVATQLGQAKTEEVLSKPYNEILVGTTTEEYGSIPDFTFYKRSTKINYYDPVNFTIIDNDLGIKKIEVTVFWKSPLGASEKNTKIASLISKR